MLLCLLADLKEPVLAPAESLAAQFSMRATYMITDEEDERLSSIYWLSTPMAEESDQELEKVGWGVGVSCRLLLVRAL